MAETVYLGPLANLTPLGSTGWGQPQRVHRDQAGSSAAFAVAPRRSTWYNCFDSSQIPAGATIDGIEIIFTGTSGTDGFGTAGSTGAGEEGTFDIRVYNGTSYSSIIHTYTAVGPSDFDNPTLGGPTDLHGLSWSETDQADFGFDVDLSSVVATPVGVVIRGCAMKVYYTESGGGGGGVLEGIQAMNQTAPGDIAAYHQIAPSNIQSINQIG